MTWIQCLRVVPEIEGLYADINGNIWSYWYQYPQDLERTLRKLSKTRTGNYHHIVTRRHSIRITILVHRAICATFKGPPTPEKPHVRHLNGNPLNNKPKNLVWGTPKENGEDKVRHGTSVKGSRNGNSKLTEDQVREIRKLRELYSIDYICRLFNVDRTCLYHIWTGKTWKHVKEDC